MPEHTSEHALPPARHEHRDIGVHPLMLGAVLMLAALAVIVIVAGAVFPVFRLDHPIRQHLPMAMTPRLQTSDRADMAAFYAKEMQRLHSTGWVDRPHGIVHIPIGQAMRDVAQHGIPGWPTGPTDTASRQ